MKSALEALVIHTYAPLQNLLSARQSVTAVCTLPSNSMHCVETAAVTRTLLRAFRAAPSGTRLAVRVEVLFSRRSTIAT